MAPETIAGRYVVVRSVGRGGMGTVWLCRDERLGREVAVKQVGVLPGESVPALARALREARSSAALAHPNVVSVFDAVEADDHIWLVMEYVPGETLAQLIAREGRLDPERVVAIGAQIADGLAAAHARGTVHRDVKPGNVLISGDLAKISDFGIARTDGDEQLTRTGLLMGTPLYFSPEIARGAEPAPAADVWALGATLYAALEGAPPVADRGNVIATLAAVAEARPPRPQHAGFLADAIGRMLDPDPVSRWTMADAAHALRRLDEKHRAAGAVAAVGTAAPNEALGTATATDTQPAPRSGRASRWPLLVGALVLLLLSGIGVAVLSDRDDPGATVTNTSNSGDRSGEPAASPTSTESTSSTPSDSSSESPSATASSPSATLTPAGTPAAQTVAAYYALLPGDTRGAWEMLGEEARAQAGGYDSYVGFWSTVDDVQVRAVSADGAIVTAELTYTTDRGPEEETRQLELDETDGAWVIAEDLGPVSA